MWPFQSEDGGQATFVARIGEEVVGYADASFGRTAVLLGGSGTHPDHRGRGVYRSLVRARWDAALAHGTSIVGWNDVLKDELTG